MMASSSFWNEFKQLVNLCIPMILISLVDIALEFTSIIFCGRLGTAQLDGVSLAISLINLIVFVNGDGMIMACDNLLPQLFGGDGKRKASVVLQKSIIISNLSMMLSAAILLNANHLLIYISKDVEVALYANQYIVYFLPTIFFFNIGSTLSNFVQCQNIVYPPMLIHLASVILNIFLHYLLVFSLNLGVIGAAIAMNISTFLVMLTFAFYIYMKKLYVKSRSGNSLECLYDWKTYLSFAIPGVISLFIEWSNVEVGTLAATALGVIELAVMTIGQQIMFIAFQISCAIAMAANVRVGNLLGANKPSEAKYAAKVAYVITVMDITAVFLVIYFGANLIPKAFDDSQQVQMRAVSFLQMIPFIHLLDAVQGTSSGVIRAVGGQFYISVISFIGYFIVGSPLGLGLMFLTDFKIFGFMYGNMVGFFVINLLQFFFLSRLNWENSAEQAHKMSLEEEADENDETKTFFGDHLKYESDEENEIEMTESRMDLMSINRRSDNLQSSKKMISRDDKIQIAKRLLVSLIILLIFVFSIFTHNLTNVSLILPHINNLNVSTNSTSSTNKTIGETINSFL